MATDTIEKTVGTLNGQTISPNNEVTDGLEPVTDRSQDRWEDTLTSAMFYGSVGLVSALLDGKPVTVVAQFDQREDGLVNVAPMYIEVSDELFVRLTPPVKDENPANAAA